MALIATAGAAHAQISWLTAVNGAWNDPSKWAGANVPDNAGEVADISVAGTYAIDYTSGSTIGGILLNNPNATVNIFPNLTMALGGTTWTNNGLVVLNSTAANLGCALRSDVPALTFAGSGTLRLNANPSNGDAATLNTNNGGFLIVNGASHSIKGVGNIRIAMNNTGVIDADSNGNTLQLMQYGKSNSGTMRASNGGVLRVEGIGINNTGGQMVANGAGSTILLSGGSVGGGVIASLNGGVTQVSNSTLSDLTVSGPMQINANTTGALGGSQITNNGTITVNPTAANLGCALRPDASVALTGSGTVVLNANPSNLDTAMINTNNGGFVLTNGANHTIRGVGNLRIATTNNGLIRADSTGNALQLYQFDKSNNNVMEAVSGGVIQVNAITVTNSASGIIRADGNGSIANYLGCSVNNGTVAAINGGLGSITNSTFRNLTITGPHQLIANSLLALSGDIVNNGSIKVNHSGANLGTSLRLTEGSVAVGGSGRIQLNATPGNVDTGVIETVNGGWALTLGANQLVDGVGAIRVATVNNGIIDANVPTAAIVLRQFGKTNNNIMRATNGGSINVEGIGIDNANAQIIADGANSVANYYSSGSVIGGDLIARNGGLGVFSSFTLSDVTLSGPHQVSANTALNITGTSITNNGVLTINPTNSNLGTQLRLNNGSLTLDGSGRVILNAVPGNVDTASLDTVNGGWALTLGAAQTVEGVGAIRVPMVNNGVIDANSGTGAIVLRQFGKTNNAIMRATSGGTLSVEGIGISNTNGQIVANGPGTIVSYNSSGSATGGQLVAANGGLGVFSNFSLNAVTLTGPHQVNGNTTLSINGVGFTNNGVLTINPSAANVNTALRLGSENATIDGTGRVVLNANPSNLDTASMDTNNGAWALTLGGGTTVEGTGVIRTTLVNNGVINANVDGAAISLRQLGKTNNNLIQATGGGTLRVEGVGISNASGQIVADGADSVVSYDSSGSVTGGRLTARNGGIGVFSNFYLNGVTMSGPHAVNPNTTLVLLGSITNNGTITVNSNAANLGTALRLDVAAATIDGNGTILLNANSGNLDTGLINTVNGAFTLTFGDQQTIAGVGAIRVPIVNNGRLSPGSDASPIGRIEQRQFAYAMTPSSQYTVDIAAVGQNDLLAGAGSVQLDGNIVVNTLNGFVPQRGDEFTVVTGNPVTGTFDHIIAPPIDANTVWRIRYTPTAAILSVTCPGDIDGDHRIELPDLATLLKNYGTPSGAQGFQGDADGDGDVDLVDLAIVLIGFGAACP